MATPEAKRAIAAARRDLAFRASVSEQEIIVAEVKAVEWPDTSMGCPEPHGTYVDQPTPGFRIVLDAISREHEYHADTSGRVVYCGKRRQG
ncbi:MAG: hypothetical protein M3Q29_13495 [Chloroflexota bacterium]|nr:hypothetical protein [Chloroflexota bacterium]